MKFLIVFLVLIVAALAAPQFGNYSTSEKFDGIEELKQYLITTGYNPYGGYGGYGGYPGGFGGGFGGSSANGKKTTSMRFGFYLTLMFPQRLLLHNHLEAVSADHSEDSQDLQQMLKLDLQALDLENNLLSSIDNFSTSTISYLNTNLNKVKLY
jgi:hypothetical protein